MRTSGLAFVLGSLVACGGAEAPQQPSPADSGVMSADAAPLDTDAGFAATDAEASFDAGPGPQYTWWQDVEPIVRQKCQLCHGQPPQFGAPRSLVAWADTHLTTTAGLPVHEMMVARIYAQQSPMPPPNQPQLTATEKAVIRAWSEAGAPEGVPPADGGVMETPDAGMAEPDAGMSGRPVSRTFEIVATQPNSSDAYQIPAGNTQYTCWAFNIPPGGAREEYVFRFEPIIVNTRHTHHTLLFKNTRNDSPVGRPFECGSFPLTWNMVAGWAPGRGADEIPPGAGVPVTAGDQFVLQVHYDSVSTNDQTDRSGMRIVLTDEPGLTPAGMLWSGVAWGTQLNGSNASKSGTCTINQAQTIFTVFPHMHRLGTRITLELQRSGSTQWITLVDINGWSFEDQPNVAIDPQHQRLMPGDRLRTSCWWNTQGRSVSFGEASDDEMCFNFVYRYPAVGSEHACISLQP